MDALERLAPVSDRYAALPVAEAFTWAACSDAVEPGEWYLVAFRSIRRTGADEVRLHEHDDRAEAEAKASPGFVHYFKGPTAADRSCLSFCMWTSRAEARAAAGQPAHRKAITISAEMYEQYVLEFHRVTKLAPQAPLAFEPYDAPLAIPAASGGLWEPAAKRVSRPSATSA